MMELIAAERRALADVLDGLTVEQWHGATMCARWTPGHVLAHLTMPFRISEQDFIAGLQRHGGNFTSFSDEIADRDSQIAQAHLVAVLRDNAENPWSVQVAATDLDWSSGTGTRIAGRSRDLLMLLARRTVPLELFEGDLAVVAPGPAARR
jgi:Mycothiol maleylpyruvate isomerase N-terminal domain